jgi:hypothetical protein
MRKGQEDLENNMIHRLYRVIHREYKLKSLFFMMR